MPKYRIRMTKTQTRISVADRTITLPTDDAAKAQAYVDVAVGFDIYDSKSVLYCAHFSSPKVVDVVTAEVLGVDPDFDEVPESTSEFLDVP